MILNKVSLENFISYGKTNPDLEFGYGINVIIGPNGAGKTSILDGVSFALFNDSGRGKKENLINSKAKTSKVCLAFTEGGVDYNAEWILDRKGPAQGSLYRDNKKKLLVKGGERTVVPEIEKILGLDKNMFLQSVYVKQGEIEKLVTARPGERKELISRLLGVEDCIDHAWNGMKDIIQTYKDKQTSLEAELKRKPKVTQQKNDFEDKINNQKGELEKDKKTKDSLIEKVAEAKSAFESYESKKSRFDQINYERSKINQNITNVENNLQKEQTD